MLQIPQQYAWIEPVLIAAAVVFVVDLIGNAITFSSRIVNALVTAIIFAAIFGAMTFYGYGSVSIKAQTTPAASAPATKK